MSSDAHPFLGWGAPLVRARFLERPNRFVVHAELEAPTEGGDGVTTGLILDKTNG